MSDLQASPAIHPSNWSALSAQRGRRVWLAAPGWAYSWLVFWSEQWTLLRILGAAGKFVIVIAVIQWFLESGERLKERHYRAWEIVNSARGSTGDGGRRDALQDLNNDGVYLAVAPLTDAYLINIQLQGAMLAGAMLPGANLVQANLLKASLTQADMTNANLASANLARADLRFAKLINASLVGANLSEADLSDADLTGANLFGASLLNANLTGAKTDQSTFCRTLMGDGKMNNANCPKQANAELRQ